MLLSLDKLEAFPLYRWMIRVLQKYYSDKFPMTNKTITEKTYESLHNEIVEHFGPYAGYAIGGKSKLEGGSITVEEDLDIKKFDAGANMFAGYEMSNGLFFQLDTQFGMLNINMESTDYNDKSHTKNNGFGLSLG